MNCGEQPPLDPADVCSSDFHPISFGLIETYRHPRLPE